MPPALLGVLVVKGNIGIIDAVGCKKDITEKIISKEASYVSAFKGNQEHLLDDMYEACNQHKAASSSLELSEQPICFAQKKLMLLLQNLVVQ